MPALAYFITYTTYGNWLHRREVGSVDHQHNEYGTPVLSGDVRREQASRRRMNEEPYVLDSSRRETVLRTLREVAAHRGWRLWAAHVRSNHVHVLVTAECEPEKVMSDFKAWSSRRLKEQHDDTDRTRWTQHGSTKHLMTEGQVAAALRYVVCRQGEPMAVWHDPTLPLPTEQEPEA